MVRAFIIRRRITNAFKLKLKLPLSLSGGLNLSTLCCELGLLLQRPFFCRLLPRLLFLFLDFPGLDLFLESSQTSLAGFALLLKVIFLGSSLGPEVELARKRQWSWLSYSSLVRS